uniref:Ribosomal protein L6 n=1 Tax=Pseudourostyla cristata TaxID=293816 RepID=A0A4P9JLP2_9SPIT|nr:ribosomal protein L6 [Pseudourostyla cristata]
MIKYDPFTNAIHFELKYANYFYKTYWKYFKKIFYSLSLLFFKKIKFKGKGYYLFKDSRHTIALKFGYSHRIYIYINYVSVKFLSKTSVLMFGINNNDIITKSYELYNTRTYNIFTTRGIRFAKQIIYKKAGKISTYR